jgi:hypothetical protein
MGYAYAVHSGQLQSHVSVSSAITLMSLFRSFIGDFIALNSIIDSRQEDDFPFLYGRRLSDLDYMKQKPPRFRGVIFRIASFFWFLIKHTTLSQSRSKLSCRVFFFAGTINQYLSLSPTITALLSKGEEVSFLVSRSLSRYLKDKSEHEKLLAEPQVISLAILLFFRRAPAFYLRLKRGHRVVEIRDHFNKFCQSYFYLAYFYRILRQQRPDLVCISNDHNVSNRCLMAVCEALEIKHLYMQHASVSDLFPPLQCHFALLDGERALETYQFCFRRSFGRGGDSFSGARKPVIFLTGQKKKIQVNFNQARHRPGLSVVGIAANQIDDYSCVISLVQRLQSLGLSVAIRTHPFQPPSFLEQLQAADCKWDTLSVARAMDEPLSDFFSRIDLLVAGNSSIHLEAALAGLSTVYFEMSNVVHKPDYYGYLKNHVSFSLPVNFERSDLEVIYRKVCSPERNNAVRQYSATFDTPWQDKEGELCASLIKKLINGENFSDIFQPFSYGGFYDQVFSPSV